MNQWYALHTKPHKERFAASHLLARKLDVFLPLVGTNPVNRRAARERPYFPGYLFIKVDLEEVVIQRLRWTPGLGRIVEFGGHPAIVPENLIFELRRRLQDRCEADGAVLERGERVRIIDGPFSGYEGIFDERLTGSERVKVLLELLAQGTGRDGRSIRIELNAGDLVRVRRHRGRRRH